MQNIFPPANLEKSWQEALREEWGKEYVGKLARFVAEERARGAVYPGKREVFAAFEMTPFESVKVVIMGQDPYHGQGQAHGLSFSVKRGVALPPSLQNIYKELKSDVGMAVPGHGELGGWARQGVLMLNATLTVRDGEPRSHYGQGWERFTDAVVDRLSQRKEGVIFVLWGKSAQEKCAKIEGEQHTFLASPHPSPFSAYHGFFGCRHFSKINDLLKQQGKEPIAWSAL